MALHLGEGGGADNIWGMGEGGEVGWGRGPHDHTDSSLSLVNRAQCQELTLGPACQAPCESNSHDPVRPGL